MAGHAASASAAIRLGVYQCPTKPAYTVCNPSNAAALDEYKNQLGRYPDIAHNYRKLDEPLLTSSEIADQAARGIEPMVTVEPYGMSLRAIADGAYDSHIHAEASVAKSFNGELLVRFAHEMNGNWYPWASGHGSTAQDYVDAWRHYVSVFREDGAANVRFVWAPNIDGGSFPFSSYFPGDSWVDYVALDGYNWGGSKWLSFTDTFASSYDTLTRLSGKPVMISETGSSEVGGDKAAWTRDAFFRAIPQRFPRVVAVTWFNRDFSAAGEQDWRIDSSSASLAAYREIVSNVLYGGTDPAPDLTEPTEPAVEPTPSRRAGKRKSATVKTLQIKTPRAAQDDGAAVAAASRDSVPQVKVVYRLSRPAPVQITIEAPHRARPVVTMTIGQSRRKGTVPLLKLIHGRALRRGAYRLVARAIDDGGAQSNTRGARLRVL
jgi:Glycosyl hydrolase family 26